MQKVIVLDNKVIVYFENGAHMEKEDLSDEQIDAVINAECEEDIVKVMYPEDIDSLIRERDIAKETLSLLEKSDILTLEVSSIYWKEVSELSLPVTFAQAVLKAEQEHDDLKIHTYKNFWTLMSLNVDEKCRKNLFWFLQTHGMTLSKCGFFVAYRNVDYTAEPGVYTDHHSHSTRIKIGDMVVLDRSKCDCDSDNECSRGLHVASKKWLTKNYFGSVGVACLVNPADVVAVPHRSEYGKLRTCAYLPIATINYDYNGNVIPLDVEDGFDCEYVPKVIYEGVMGTETDSPYKIVIPDLPGIPKVSLQNTLLDIAKECIINRNLKDD